MTSAEGSHGNRVDLSELNTYSRHFTMAKQVFGRLYVMHEPLHPLARKVSHALVITRRYL